MWALRLYNLLSDRRRPMTSPSHLAPAIAALMACADAVERGADPLAPAPPLLERMAVTAAEVRHAPARAIALACVGRFAARRQDADLARKRFQDALQTITESHDRDVLPCLQWPPRLEARVVGGARGVARPRRASRRSRRRSRASRAAGRCAAMIAANRIESLRLRLTAALRVPEMPASASLRGASPIVPRRRCRA